MATPIIEEYLEAIYVMGAENPPVRSARLADVMGVSAPTVTDTLRRLVQQGYVAVADDKAILLTRKGKEAAESLVRRHCLSERWLVDVLGMDWAKVHDEACKLEHVLSPEVEERLATVLRRPATCPHGNPIPGIGDSLPQGMRLSELAAGSDASLLRISPEGEKNVNLLDYLRKNGLVPGVSLSVVEVAPWNGVVTVEVGRAKLAIGLETATLLWVLPKLVHPLSSLPYEDAAPVEAGARG